MSFNSHTLYGQIFKIWRQRRFSLFLKRLKPEPTDTLLDVGGYPWFWLSHAQTVKRIDTLNVHEVAWTDKETPHQNIHTMVGDGCALALADQSYDIGFSNSVIEHVGSWEQQQRFASEIRRVAKRLWVQTPAYECPVEPHYMAPFIHYLPRSLQKRMVRWATLWGWLDRPNREQINAMVDTTRLLRKAEMRQLFPDCEIVTERLLWIIPKSYVAIRASS